MSRPIQIEPENLACAVCLKEIPSSVAHGQEGDDYMRHFCGIECYSVWKKTHPLQPPTGEKTATED